MKKVTLLFVSITSLLMAQNNSGSINSITTTDSTVSITNEPTATSSINSEPAKTPEPTVEATPEEQVQAKPKQEEKPRQKKQIRPIFGGGIQYYNSRLGTSVWAINLEGGVQVQQNKMVATQHTIDGYWAISKSGNSQYNIGDVWGVNYNFLFLVNLGSKIRVDLGAKAGYNIYEELSVFDDSSYKTVTFGGPQAQLNFNLDRIRLGAGYTMFLGYREYNGDKTSTRMDQFNFTLGFGR